MGDDHDTLKRAEGWSVRCEGPIYIIDVDCHLTRSLINESLATIWADPQWCQPWGVVVTVTDAVTYDADIRNLGVPSAEKRAVGAAIVSPKQLHRMVVATIGVGLRAVQGFRLEAHDNTGRAVDSLRQAVLEAQSSGRPF